MQNKHQSQEVKKHICDLCGNRYMHKSALKNHIESTHGEKNHNCDICNKKYVFRTL